LKTKNKAIFLDIFSRFITMNVGMIRVSEVAASFAMIRDRQKCLFPCPKLPSPEMAPLILLRDFWLKRFLKRSAWNHETEAHLDKTIVRESAQGRGFQ